MGLFRYSSRLNKLDHMFLRDKLRNARLYKRIAGYFRSSLLELVHEELEAVEQVRIVCNSDLDPSDLRVAQLRASMLKEKWNERSAAAEGLLSKDRYRRLFELLSRPGVEVRVISRAEAPFLHGKAGMLELLDGSRTSFVGSLNETREGWREHYEILWEDTSPEGVAWVEAEFDWLWNLAVPLDRVVIDEIERLSQRSEYKTLESCPAAELPAAAMVEAPLYERGERLMPYQQAFVGLFLEHREIYGKARLLLCDEVGLGKTLSLATSGLVACLLGDGPVLILCPATLRFQWQTELLDKLGIPSAVWTTHKTWLDPWGHEVRTRGADDIARCPYQIGIVSTGLIFRHTGERAALLTRRYGTVVLDEAHRARRSGGLGKNAGEPNNLLDFMLQIGWRSRHLLLGTATPIQTDTRELWDLLEVLACDAEFVLGRAPHSRWRGVDTILPIVTGQTLIQAEGEFWELARNPLPPRQEDLLFDWIRTDLELRDDTSISSQSAVDLKQETREELLDRASSHRNGMTFFQRHNPIVRHTVLRKRRTLEDSGLLPKVAVDIHPAREDAQSFFSGLALLTSPTLDAALRSAEVFTRLVAQRTRSAGFLKSLLLQRICSSLAAGLSTAQKLLDTGCDEDEDEDGDAPEGHGLHPLSDAERERLAEVVEILAQGPDDPKLGAVVHYLLHHTPRWLELGCIIFSQYYDTARWVAEQLASKLPGEPIALYAGASKSRIGRDNAWANVDRRDIQGLVKRREIRLVVATDAACEGLNLQTLGTLINVDLPWNPSRLEQRVGRVKRVGQVRDRVDMLNLVYKGTRDEVVYERISQRMKDRFDLFGSLPDVIQDDWIEDQQTLDLKLSEFIEKRRTANAFDIRYRGTLDPKGEPWENCARVLSRKDISDWMARGW